MPRAKAQGPSWVRYQPRQVLLGVLGLSPAAELAHRRLCDFAWSPPEHLPATPRELARLVRVPRARWPRIWLELRRVGWRIRKGRLANPAVSAIVAEARRHLAGYAARGSLGGTRTQEKRQSSLAADKPPPVLMPVNSTLLYPNKSSNCTEHSLLSAALPSKGGTAESDFMSDVRHMLEAFAPASAQSELTNWGGWWRNRFRQDPRKARAVLADIAAMVKERRIRKTPAAAAQDLWKRLP
jgi:hypothetical protein